MLIVLAAFRQDGTVDCFREVFCFAWVYNLQNPSHLMLLQLQQMGTGAGGPWGQRIRVGKKKWLRTSSSEASSFGASGMLAL